jgi:hypothetical protein
MKDLGVALITIIFVACSADNYDTGDGKYSYLCADFVEAHTVAASEINYAMTDDGDSLVLSPHAMVSWAMTKDSTYRALLYYNKVETLNATPVSISRVPVVVYRLTADIDTVHTDPVVFESAWMSKNNKYLNVGFSVKTGKSGTEDYQQTVGMMCDSLVANADGTHDLYLRMLHNQNGVPQYYSSRNFLSIPLKGLSKGYTIHLIVNTYDGLVNKDFIFN